MRAQSVAELEPLFGGLKGVYPLSSELQYQNIVGPGRGVRIAETKLPTLCKAVGIERETK